MGTQVKSRKRWEEPRLSRLHVLVTEDNLPLRQLMADVLRYEGHIVAEAADAVEMQAAIMASGSPAHVIDPFDLVVSDVFMPGKNGLDAVSELRQSGLRSRVLFVTSFPDMVTYGRIEELDVRMLAKPFSLKEFRTVTRQMLQESASATEGSS